MADQTFPRTLSHDEKKAAEAAFAGRPFNPAWSSAARQVYEGIVNALPKDPTLDVIAQPDVSLAPADDTLGEEKDPVPQDADAAPAPKLIGDRADAIREGALIDVTGAAQQLGMTYSIAVTRPLWEVGIAAGGQLSEQDQHSRLRDVLMAFRLRLAGLTSISPLIDFPALLSLPPDAIPQPVSLLALIQQAEKDRTAVTLLLPNEVSTTIVPLS